MAAHSPWKRRLTTGRCTSASPSPLLDTGANLYVFDVASDTVSGAIHLFSNKYNFGIRSPAGHPHRPGKPATGCTRSATTATPSSRSILKPDSPVGALVFNDETFRPHSFAKRPGHPTGYALIHQSANTFELDLDAATVNRVVALPEIRADAYSYDAAFTDAGRLLVSQGRDVP